MVCGTHAPVHTPPLHTSWQAVPLCHVPVASQVCGVLPGPHCID